MLLQLLLAALSVRPFICIQLLMLLILQLELRIGDDLLRGLMVYSKRLVDDGVITFIQIPFGFAVQL